MIKNIVLAVTIAIGLVQSIYAFDNAIVRVSNKIKLSGVSALPSFPAVAFFTLGDDGHHHPVHANGDFTDIKIEPNKTYSLNVLHMIFGNTDQTCIDKSCKDLKINLQEGEIINVEIHSPPHDQGDYGMVISCQLSKNFMKW